MSAVSDLQIANMALGSVGARSRIQSLTESTKEANTVADYYDTVKTALLRAVQWGFARKQSPGTLIADATLGQSVPTPWNYKYQYPADCLKMRQIVPQYQSVAPSISGQQPTPVSPVYRGPIIKWLLNGDVDANNNPIVTILTNQPQAIFVYTYNAPNAVWDSMFVDAFVGALAAKICIPVNGDKKLAQMAIEVGRNAITEARVSNGNEAIQQQEIMPDWMKVRGYLPDYAYSDLFLYAEDPGVMGIVS